ncbi:MAG: hypothetical protein PHT07_00070 [Paludibacter sp.]|nr:hypothetical protein [Paludibacter sp.]
MKSIIKVVFLLASVSLHGQTVNMKADWQKEILGNLSKTEYKDSLNKYDFGKLWTVTENQNVYGFIGENYLRIKIKILNTTRFKTNQDEYEVYGKTLVKNNICDFHGTITLNRVRVYKVMHWGVDDEYKNKGIKKQGLLIAKYHLEEDSTQIHSGVFEGILFTSWYVDKSGQLQYDKIENNSDNFRNNQFIGTWKDYMTKKKKVCNWGDFRVHNCGDFDMGAGEFSPADKYLKFGWQTYRDAYFNNNKLARQEEEQEWWK